MNWITRRIGTLSRLLSDPDFRTLSLLRIFNRSRLHQTTVYTEIDRYPNLFRRTQRCLEHLESPRILSFGCATGEEVITLRRYFPEAFVVGAELNPRSLSHCKSLQVDSKIRFIKSTHENLIRNGPYDAIFCLAVLQRTPHVVEDRGLKNINKIYPFRRFERQLARFDKYLLAGGIIVIVNAQYLVEDTLMAKNYQSLSVDLGITITQQFDRCGDILAEGISGDMIFIKTR